MNSISLSRMVFSQNGEPLYSFEYAASVTETSPITLERFAELGLIEPIGAMLRSRDIERIAKIMRLRRDLGLNLVGASMVLDMAEEIAQLQARLRAYQLQKFE